MTEEQSYEEYEEELRREKESASEKAKQKPLERVDPMKMLGLDAKRILSQLKNFPVPKKDYCMVCGGSTRAPIFKNGVRYNTRCPGAYPVKEEGRLHYKCQGFDGWADWIQPSKDDLCNEIFLVLQRMDGDKEKFYRWLNGEYFVQGLDELNLELLEAVLVKARSFERKKAGASV